MRQQQSDSFRYLYLCTLALSRAEIFVTFSILLLLVVVVGGGDSHSAYVARTIDTE